MRHFLLTLISILFLGNIASAQNPIFQSIQLKKSEGAKFSTFSPFQKAQNRPANMKSQDAIYEPLVLQKAILTDLHQENPIY
jgi:hypothetical protein